jgi:hypothetical protein
MEIGDVLSFREVMEGKYDVVRINWAELTNQVKQWNNEYELQVETRVPA